MNGMNQGQQQLNIDPDKMKDEVCGTCGHPFFVQVFRIKSISALLSPTGQDMAAPMPTFVCADCGTEIGF